MWKRFSHTNELRSQRNLSFKHGSLKRIDPETKVAEWLDRSGKTQHQAYDYLIMATGLKRHWPAVPKSGSYEEYLQDGMSFISKIVGGDPRRPQEGRRVVVIGAGAVGIEFAGEIKTHYPGIKVTLIHSREQVLSSEPLPSDVKDKVKDILVEEGVEVITGNRAAITELSNKEFEVKLANGTVLTADFVIDSTRKGEPTTDPLPNACLNKDREVKVNLDLSFQDTIPNAASHFGVGDVVEWSGIKRAGSAMVMGQTAAHNIYAAILNSENTRVSVEEQYKPLKLNKWEPVIGIAIGKQCLTWGSEGGMKYGVEVMQGYFGDDLGWAGNLKYMGLTDLEEKMELEKPEAVRMGEVGVKEISAAA
jgi:NADH dehydrogenase FAD-containing subunit